MASISSPTQLASFTNAQASSSRLPHISLAPVHGSRGRLAVAAVNGDGVWTYDIKTVRPTTSFTVPPSTVFTSAPLSFVPESEDEEEPKRVTAVGVQSSDSKSAVWVWEGEEGEKRSTKVDSVAGIHGTSWPLVIVGVTGGLSLLDAELKMTSLLAPRAKAGRVISSALLGSRIVTVDDKGKICVYSLDVEAGSATLTAESSGAAGYLAASAGEVISAIDVNNRLHSRKLSDIVDGVEAEAGLALAHPTTPAGVITLPVEGRPLSILTTSHGGAGVTLVSPSPDLPAALSTSLLSTGGSQVTYLAVLSTSPLTLGAVQTHAGANSRSIIHTMDIALPAKVGLAQLVGSSVATSDVFRTSQSTGGADKVIEAVSSALKAGDAARAESTFATWLEDEEKKAPGRRFVIPESAARKLVDAVFSTATKDKKVYASKIVSSLIERRQLHEEMYTGGVVPALLAIGDLRAIARLVRSNPALPSRTTVALLAVAGPHAAQILEDVVSGPSPDPAYRAELRRQLDAAGAARILAQLTHWAEAHAERDDGLGAWLEAKPPKSKIPAFDKVIAHASALLDAHLPNLLESQDELKRLQEAIAPAMAAQNDYRRLRAPVDAALRAQRENLAQQAKDDRRRRQFKQEKTGLSDEAFGKWRVEDFVF